MTSTNTRIALRFGFWIAGPVAAWLAFVAGACETSNTTPRETGELGGGSGESGGSCPDVAAKFEECELSPVSGCSSQCENQCMLAATCDELDAFFFEEGASGLLGACLDACASNGEGAGGDVGGGEGASDPGGGGSDTGSGGSSGSSGGLRHPACAGIGSAVCGCPHLATEALCDPRDCAACMASYCDLTYDQCPDYWDCLVSDCGDGCPSCG